MDEYNNDAALSLWAGEKFKGGFEDVDIALAGKIKAALEDGTLNLSLEDVPASYQHNSAPRLPSLS